MGTDWRDNPQNRRSPMDTGNYGRSGKGTRKQTMFAVLAFLALPAGVVGGVAAYLAHGYGVM